MLRKAGILATLSTLAVVAGCSQQDAILPGERISVHDALESRLSEGRIQNENQSRAAALPKVVSNSSWTQSHVSPHARISHPALAKSLTQVWSTSIGAGDTRRNRLNVDPVMGNGAIYTVDSNNQVRATSAAGELVWSYDLTPDRDAEFQAQGGGLAFSDGTLYVASGFGLLTALDASNGQELWTQKLGHSATGAPSVYDGVVYVVSGDTTGWAIEADTGRVRWQIDAQGDVNNIAGAPAPAISRKFVTFSYGAATVQTAFRQGGLTMWNSDLLGRRNGVALAGITDLTGDPVVVGETIYAGSHSGRTVALKLGNGERIWTAQFGALGPVWPAGDSVYFVSDRNQLVRLDAKTGETIWAVSLPGYKPERNPNRRRDVSYSNHGPVLAGGRLIVAGSDGQLRSFDPTDGTQISSIEIPGGATTRPIVAGGTLYVVSGKGNLIAFR
ncbi:MAG: PQQ-like beta-propeller repeat protein [Pelagimonas sp.]|jgi:outer membrane protein assembly factor BamB|nr:PQQ-like beta-propeller repeat protein [Pelagimonas sp.]